MMVPIVSVVGVSDSGKTTLLEKIISELSQRGLRLGVVKHDVHGFEMDHPGKDTYRLHHSGATCTAILGPDSFAAIRRSDSPPQLVPVIESVMSDLDLVLTEGFKSAPWAKIEVLRKECEREPLMTIEDGLIALVTDGNWDRGVPRFGLEEIDGIVALIEEFIAAHPQQTDD